MRDTRLQRVSRLLKLQGAALSLRDGGQAILILSWLTWAAEVLS